MYSVEEYCQLRRLSRYLARKKRYAKCFLTNRKFFVFGTIWKSFNTQCKRRMKRSTQVYYTITFYIKQCHIKCGNKRENRILFNRHRHWQIWLCFWTSYIWWRGNNGILLKPERLFNLIWIVVSFQYQYSNWHFILIEWQRNSLTPAKLCDDIRETRYEENENATQR